jgi:hypothetical protein
MPRTSTIGGEHSVNQQTSTPQPSRLSKETERRHLLSDSHSIAPSDSLSQLEPFDGDRTPRAGSPARAESQSLHRGTIGDIATSGPTAGYRGFPTEAHYLAALRSWADSKRYVENESALVGFYGETTMTEYCERPRVEFGFKKLLRERKQRMTAAREARRNTVA